MIDRKIAKEQLRRCGGMPGQPDDEVAIDESIKALTGAARSKTHARRIVDSLLAQSQFFPTVAEILTTAEQIEGDELPAGCRECRGDPWITGERSGVSCAVRCSCERGRYLAARDAEKRGAAPAQLVA
jgi:hypothetical protein